MDAAGLAKFWRAANRSLSALYPGEITVYGLDQLERFTISDGVALGGQSREARFRPGGVGETLSITARIDKTEWPEGEELPPTGALIQITSARLFPDAPGNAGQCRVMSIRGYQDGEPAWVFDLAGVNT